LSISAILDGVQNLNNYQIMDSLINQLLFFLRTPAGMLAVVVVIFIIIAMRKRKKKIFAEVTRMEEKATSMNMKYSAPVVSNSDVTVMSDGKSVSISDGTHTFEGTNHGISWIVKSVILKDVDQGHMRKAMGPQYTRWSTELVRTSGTDYIMLMDLRDRAGNDAFAKTTPKKSGGFLSGMADKVAGMVLGYFMESYFGKIQHQNTPTEPGHRSAPSSPKIGERYAIFSNNEMLTGKVLTQELEEFLLNETKFRPSVLINSAGIMTSCPTFMIDSSEIQALAEYSSGITARIQKNLNLQA
jgi:hypothetical protein